MLKFIKKHVDKLAGLESIEEYKKKLDSLEVNEQIKRAILLEIEQAYSVQTNNLYEFEDRKKFMILEDIFNFPWNKRDKIEWDLDHTKNVFESNLYGMSKVKDRVYEYIAKIKRLSKDNKKKGFVILITDPPGTGKTIVAQLIENALKRKTGLINLSGENDTITLKGIKRTYVDSQPSKERVISSFLRYFL